MPAAGDERVAVALQQPDLVEWNAEAGAEHLGKRRSMPLAIIERAGDDRYGAVWLEADAAHLAAGRAGQFEVIADATPPQFPARPAFGFARGKPVPIGERQGLVQEIGEIAAIIGRAVGRFVRHRLRRDVVAPPQLDTVDPHLCCSGVDEPLHIVVGLGSAGPAIGADRRRVREGAFGRDFDQGRLVDAERVSHGVTGRRPRGAVSGSEIAKNGQSYRQKIAVAIERQFDRCLGIAAMRVGHEAARAVVGPFDRAAEFAGGVQQAVILGIGRLLHPERTADAIGQYA